MAMKPYSRVEGDLVSDWAANWLELVGFVNEITGTDDPSYLPLPPTNIDELKYQSLRSWFREHQARFVPLWNDFYQDRSSRCDWDSDHVVDAEELSWVTNYYDPERLSRIVWQHRDSSKDYDPKATTGLDEKSEGFDELIKNPFLLLYEPEDLYQWAEQLGLQKSTVIWEPDEYELQMLRPVMISMGRIMLIFVDWINERTYDT